MRLFINQNQWITNQPTNTNGRVRRPLGMFAILPGLYSGENKSSIRALPADGYWQHNSLFTYLSLQ